MEEVPLGIKTPRTDWKVHHYSPWPVLLAKLSNVPSSIEGKYSCTPAEAPALFCSCFYFYSALTDLSSVFDIFGDIQSATHKH